MVPSVSSAMVSSITLSEEMSNYGFGGQRSLFRLTQSSTMPVQPMVVAQASLEPISVSSALIGSAKVNGTSQVAMEDGDEDFGGSEGSATTNDDSDLEEVHLLGPTIRELVGDLDKSWSNSKEWMLQLRDGRQLVLPLSLYRSPDCMSICSGMEGEFILGISYIVNEGQRVSWANEGEGLVDSLSMVSESENEIWEFDERLMTWERGGEPLVVVTLATEGPLELVSSPVKELGCKESVDNSQLSQWVTNRLKAFKKSVGTSLEGFEEQITGLLLAIETRRRKKKRDKWKHVVGDQTQLVKLRQKSQRKLKSLLSSLNVEYGSNKLRSASMERIGGQMLSVFKKPKWS